MREEIASQSRDDSLRRNRQQVHLRKIQCSLNRKEADQSNRNPVEQLRVALNECSIEQLPHDLRKGEPDSNADDETENSCCNSRCMRTDTRKQLPQRPGSWKLQIRLIRHQMPPFLSTAIATNKSAR